MPLDLRRVFSVAVAVGVVLVVALIGALWVTIDRSRDSSSWVVHTYSVLDATDLLESSAIRVEAGQRGLLISGAARFIRERDGAIEEANAAVAELQRLTTDNAAQQARLELLAEQIANRVRMARQNEQAVRAGLVDGRAAVESAEARQAASALAATISQIKMEERRLLRQRRADEVEFQRRTVIVLVCALLGGGLLIGVIYGGYRRQARLRDAVELRLRDLVQALPVSLWQLRARAGGSASFEFISDNARAVRHIDPDAARQRAHEVAMANVHLEDRAPIERALRHSARTLVPLDVQYRIDTEDGGQRWIRSGASLRREPDGSVLWSGYWADATEELVLKQALESATQEAVRANAAKSAFLAAMSHEIRTPMNGVLGLLELLSLSRLDEEQRSTLTVVRESGRSLLRIVDDILDFSKIEANKLSLHPVPASVAHIVQSTCHIHSSLASGKDVLLEAHIDPRISPSLLVDPQRLGQILNNLVSNALKFTERGSVTVDVRWLGRGDSGEQLAFLVSDTGIGLDPEDVARLFQPFVQSDAASGGRFGGTGLGLVISRRLAEMMGGSIEMESERGRGTTVTMRCEFVPAPGEASNTAMPPGERSLPATTLPRRPTPTREQAEREGTLILVVDDHPTNRMVLRRQVNSLGYAAEVAADGRQAYDMWRTGRFGLVLADCNMPEMSGYELTQAIRADEQALGLARTPVLACTANAMASQAAACSEAGMDAWLVKPCGLEELSRQLSRWLPQPVGEPIAIEAEEPAIDPSLLDAAVGGDDAVRAEILADFRRANEVDAAALRTAAANVQLAEVALSAHRIKGACLSLGAGALAEACGRIELVARGRDTESLAGLMVAFERQFARLSEHLDAPQPAGPSQLLAD